MLYLCVLLMVKVSPIARKETFCTVVKSFPLCLHLIINKYTLSLVVALNKNMSVISE